LRRAIRLYLLKLPFHIRHSKLGIPDNDIRGTDIPPKGAGRE
jgi:hypothetical protein